MRVKFLTFILVLSLVGLLGINSESYANVSPTPTENLAAQVNNFNEDSDNDNYSDLCEYLHKTNPNDSESKPSSNITINVPSDVKTIQGAINASIDGDTIAVSQGKYKGNINFNGKTITITSTDSLNSDVVANTIIEGTESGSVVTIDSVSVLKGFTITSKGLDCRGIYCKDASPTIENCTIIDNQTTESGGGIYISTTSSRPKIINCIISGNKDSSGIHESAQVSGGTPQISQSWINGTGLVDNTTEVVSNQTTTPTTEIIPTETTPPIAPDTATPIIPDETTIMEPATIILKSENSYAITTDIVYTPYAVHFTGVMMAGEWNSVGWSEAFVLDDWSDIIEPGEYPDTAEAIPNAVDHTLDGIAIHAGTRVIIYSEKNFQGDILLEKSGPAIINNVRWINYPRYNVVMTEDWPEPLQGEFPQSVREWSETDMYANSYLWGNGSFKIIIRDYWYVDDDVAVPPEDRDGRTWETAFKYLQDALNNPALIAGDGILVAEGTYKPDQDKNNPIGTSNRYATFRLINGVTIQGGYAGLDYVELGAPSPYTRDIGIYQTILSGDIGISDNITDNSYHVVTGSETDATTILDGFTITGGNADGSGSYSYGGGMYNADGSPTVTNCRFSANLAVLGGAIFSGTTTEENYIEIDSCQVLDQPNTAYYLTKDLTGEEVTPKCICIEAEGITFDGQGHSIKNPNLEDAVIYSEADNVTIRNCDVQASSQYFSSLNNGKGKGIFITADNNIVKNNKVSNTFWGILVHGSGNIIDGNIAEGNAKGIHLGHNDPANPNIIKNNLLKNNNKHQGWGLGVWVGESNEFINNKVYGNKYGLVLYDADNTLLKCNNIYENTRQNIYYYPNTQNVTTDNNCDDIDYIIVDSCQILDDPNTTYRLATDLTGEEVTPKCICIEAEGITFDGQGHSIKNTNLEDAVIYSNANNVTIRNFDLTASSQYFSSLNNGKGHGIQSTGNNCLIENNKVMDTFWGIRVSGVNTVIQNNVLEGNAKGIHLSGGSNSMTVKNNLLKNNNKHQGWGLGVWVGESNEFINNKVYGNKYGIVLYGANHILLKCDQYFNNSAKDIYLYGNSQDVNAYGVTYSTKYISSGAEFNEFSHDCTVLDCIWSADVCEVAAITNEQSSPIFTNCVFSGNYARQGGAMENHQSSPIVTNCIFWDNSGDRGRVIFNDSSSPTITNCTFSGNGTGYSIIYNWDSDPIITNCILWDDGEEIYNAGTSNPTVTYCDIYGGYAGGIGNINSDPLFVDADNPAGPDGIFRTSDDGLQLGEGSPCINKSNSAVAPPTDILGTERFSIADMGAYEFKFVEWTTLEGFYWPSGIYYDNTPGEEYIYVADSGNNRIVKTNIEGDDQDFWGGFSDPSGIYYDNDSGYIYVADRCNNRIVKTKLNPGGTFTDFTSCYGSNGPISGEDDFYWPTGIYYDNTPGEEYIYVADSGNERIVKTKIDGDGWTSCYGSLGSIPGGDDFYWPTGYWPTGIYYDNTPGEEYIYVADRGNARIVKTKIDGGDSWTPLGGFNWPYGIYYDSASEYIYVAIYDSNTHNGYIAKTKIDGGDSRANYYANYYVNYFSPEGISYDLNTGYIYVADTNNHCIVRIYPLSWH